MNDKAGHMTTKGDTALRRAIARREARLPKMPDTLNSMVMERVPKPCRRRRMLRLVCGAAASVAIIAMLGVKWASTPPDNHHATATMPTAAEPKPTILATSATPTAPAAPATHGQVCKRTKAYTQPAKPQQSGCGNTSATETDTMATYQKQVADYIAMLAQTYHAEALPIDCRTGGSNTVYIFGDDDESDVFQKLCMIALWIDTDRPGVRMAFDQGQMTLELNDSSRQGGTDQLWLADRRNGHIYLYRSQSDTDAWRQSACYTAFVGQEGRKTEN